MALSRLQADLGQGLASLWSGGEMELTQETAPSFTRGSVLSQGTWVPLYGEERKDFSVSSHPWSSCLFPLAGTEAQKFSYDPFSGPHPWFFFGNLKPQPKFPLPNFSLWEPQPGDVRLNIRRHWSSQAWLCDQLPVGAPSLGVRWEVS